MQQELINEAWTAYEKAANYDETRRRLTAEGKHASAARANRKVDEHLDRAASLEAAAFADEAIAA